MRCLLIAATPTRVEPYAGILAVEGFEVEVRIAGGPGTVRADDAGAFPVTFVDLELGLGGVRAVCEALLSPGVALPPIVAIIGEPVGDEEIDAIIGSRVSMYVEEDADVFKKRVRFLQRALAVRNRASKLMAEVQERDLRHREAEQQVLELLESAPDAVLLHRDGKALWCNERWAGLLGYDDPKSLVGIRIMEFVSPRFRATVSDRISRAVEAHMVLPSMEQALLHKDGSEVHAIIFGGFTVFGGRPALAAFARDTREQRRLELQLTAADRLAALGRLAAGVGHEINNPLAYVIGNMQLALQEIRDGDHLDAIERLEEALGGAERIRLIVRDLRVFGVHAPESLVPVDLHRVIDSCARVAESEIRLRATLVRDFGDVPLVLASEPRLAQVVLNLLVNSTQAIPDDRANSHTITLLTRTGPDGTVLLRVSDTGVGIEPDVLPHVAEPFFTTRADTGGTGLGLSICSMLVTDLGGTLEIESELGRGTTVTVRLRAATGNSG
jgi:two-component system, NtrC family, sensor kinase